jgi:hypothetical protein
MIVGPAIWNSSGKASNARGDNLLGELLRTFTASVGVSANPVHGESVADLPLATQRARNPTGHHN